MTEEDKKLLLKDLCARLSYDIIASVRGSDEEFQYFYILGVKDGKVWVKNDILRVDKFVDVEVVKPYLRPMESMTEEEYKDLEERFCWDFADIFDKNRFNIEIGYSVDIDEVQEFIDWLNQHHFDYRGLIEKGLALEAPEEMYN